MYFFLHAFCTSESQIPATVPSRNILPTELLPYFVMLQPETKVDLNGVCGLYTT